MRYVTENKIIISAIIGCFLYMGIRLNPISCENCQVWTLLKLTPGGLVTFLLVLALKLSPRKILSQNERKPEEPFINQVTHCCALRNFVSLNAKTDQGDESEKDRSKRIFYITGSQGRGKTQLLLRFANDLIQNTPIRSKKAQGSFWQKIQRYCCCASRKVAVYYVELTGTKDMLTECCEKLAISDKKIGSSEAFRDHLKIASRYQNIVFILDGISAYTEQEAIKFALTLVEEPGFHVFLGVTIERTSLYKMLQPSLFNTTEVRSLANSYGLNLYDNTIAKIVELTQGNPGYSHLLIKLRHANPAIDLSSLNHLEDLNRMIGGLVANLSAETQTIIGVFAYLDLIGIERVLESEIRLLLPSATHQNIEEAILSSILFREQDSKQLIRMSPLIAHACRAIFPQKKYMGIIKNHYGTSKSAMIRMSLQLLGDKNNLGTNVKDFLKNALKNHQYVMFARLGEEDRSHYLLIQEEDYYYFSYCYLSSLLQLGQYTRAYFEMLRLQNAGKLPPLSCEIISDDAFEIQYLLIDLHHLSNQFDTALEEIDCLLNVLPNAFKNTEKEYKLLYLKAHCLKHIGDDLKHADSILSYLQQNNLENELAIKVLYSRLAINLFLGDDQFQYEKVFDEIDTRLKTLGETPIRMHVERHRAIYMLKQKKDLHSALEIIERALTDLEKTQYRIIYDFYFEKAELLRLKAHQPQDLPVEERDMDTILSLYRKAIAFAEDNGDLNLKTSAQLGSILALHYFCQTPVCELLKEVESIQRSLTNDNSKPILTINFNEALYVEALLKGVCFDDNEINHWRQIHVDLARSMENGDALKLTVM